LLQMKVLKMYKVNISVMLLVSMSGLSFSAMGMYSLASKVRSFNTTFKVDTRSFGSSLTSNYWPGNYEPSEDERGNGPDSTHSVPLRKTYNKEQSAIRLSKFIADKVTKLTNKNARYSSKDIEAISVYMEQRSTKASNHTYSKKLEKQRFLQDQKEEYRKQKRQRDKATNKYINLEHAVSCAWKQSQQEANRLHNISMQTSAGHMDFDRQIKKSAEFGRQCDYENARLQRILRKLDNFGELSGDDISTLKQAAPAIKATSLKNPVEEFERSEEVVW
jgi:hypothetical protein